MAGTFFDRVTAVAEKRLDTIMAENFSYQPMRVPKNGDPVVDDSRDGIDSFKAVWIDPHERINVDKESPQLAGDSPQIRPIATVFRARPQKGDEFVRLSVNQRFKVEAVRLEGSGARYVIELDEAD